VAKNKRLLYPDGKIKCLTLSYDDGVNADRRLVEIMNKHGVRGSFHVNSGRPASDGHIPVEEYKEVYAGHEISVHSATHPMLEMLPETEVVNEIIEDRRALEGAAGYVVRGMSYPMGTYSQDVIAILRKLGITYARTTKATQNFLLPGDFLEWHPTCHHNHDLDGLSERFLNMAPWYSPLFYVWGHSYEFDNDDNWNVIEDFCAKMGGMDQVWYATNQEIVDYVTAARNLVTSIDGSMWFNPSAQSVWYQIDGETVEIAGGQTVTL
jgi:peptidoglycan/xylan/chitin deacetylase (PgdA/CDA1 family)